MASMKISEFEMAEIFNFNNARRASLLAHAKEKPTKFEQLKLIVDYFLNILDVSEIAKIDGVSNDKVIPFIYDYSFIEDYEAFPRMQYAREYTPGGYAPTINMSITDENNLRIYPSIFTLKMATCQMFASEIARFSKDLGIDCEIVSKITSCYDHFEGTNEIGERLSTDQIVNMKHYYNVINIDGKKLKIDIAGGLTGVDYNRNHSGSAVDLSRFYFSENLNLNPFNHIVSFSDHNISNEDFSVLFEFSPQ